MENLYTDSKWKKYGLLILLSLGASTIYLTPFLMNQYINQIHMITNISLVDLQTLMTVYGVVSLVLYIPGGWVADRLSPKMLFSTSMFAATLLTIWYSFIGIGNGINYIQLVFIYLLYAIVNSLIFWSAFIKAIGLLDKETEHTRLYANSEITRNVVAVIIGFISIGLLSIATTNNIFNINNGQGIFAVLIFYACTYFVVAILGAIFIPGVWIQKFIKRNTNGIIKYKPATWNTIIVCNDEDSLKLAKHNYYQLFWEKVRQDSKESLKSKDVWLLSLLIFFIMNCYAIMTAFGSIFSANHNIDLSTSSLLNYLYNYCTPIIGCIAFNFLTNRKTHSPSHSVVYCNIGLVLSTLLLFIIVLIPFNSKLTLGIVGIIILSISMIFIGGNRAIYWSILTESKINRNIVGIAAGIISIIGFSENIWVNPVCALIMKPFIIEGTHQLTYSNEAFVYLFLFNLANAIGAIIISFVLYARNSHCKWYQCLIPTIPVWL